MRYRIIATVNASPKEFQAIATLLMEKAEKVEVEQIANGQDHNPPPHIHGQTGKPKLTRWPSGLTIRVSTKEPMKETRRGNIAMDWELWQYIKKKYGTIGIQKGYLANQAKKDYKNSKTFKANSISPCVTQMLDGGYLEVVPDADRK
jgi:hypothetical protein